ncbi:MAG: hypothetical protein AUG51_24635 [Acidobacteria bacterium 13_1_20CM_3_53_8]|nr:MAG: hypothetical protein AUG51_24635 [Acidobacteria bacterium 13_1_20CM_3_53_8]
MDLDESDEEFRSIPPVKQVAAAKPTSRQRSPDFSLAWLEKQREELDKRDAARARTQVMLNESIEDFDDPDADRMELDTENALGKDSSEKVKAALSKIGGDIGQEGGYRLFRHARKERKFDTAWIRGVEWLEGFDGMFHLRSGMRLIVDDETRAEHIRYGFAKQMVDLGEKLHPELIIWFLEHSILEG